MPILTKVDPNDEDFDFDIFKDDFENVLKNELNNQFPGFDNEDDEDPENEQNQIDSKKPSNFDEDDEEDIDEDKQYHRKNRQKVWAFYKFFIKNIKVFDPLDR